MATHESRTWVTIVSVAAPVLSAVFVAFLTQQTNLRLAELEKEASESATAIEQTKLRDQQDSRRQQFMVANMPRLLSDSESERRIGKALLFVSYPDEAADILKLITPAAGQEIRISLEEVQREAQALQEATGDWSIVVAAERALDQARAWAARLEKDGYSPVSVYRREGVYRIAVGNYPTRQLAEQAAIAVRRQARPDAYVVALGRWCRAPTAGDRQVIECGER